MMQRKYSLPRHTNLANTSTRFGAFFIDVAIGFLLAMLLFFGAQNIFWFNGGYDLNKRMVDYTIESNLCYIKTDEQGNQSVTIYDTTNEYEIYEEHVSYFYLHYLTGDVEEGMPYAPNFDKPIKKDDGSEVLPKDFYSVSWFNYNILGITEEDPDRETSSLYFTYRKDADGNYDKTQIGTPKWSRYNSDKGKVVELTREDITVQYKSVYQVAYRYLEAEDFYQEVARKFYFGYSLCATLCALVSGAVIYIVIPLFLKNGQTIGKKILKLGLANYEGYRFKNNQLWMRFVPFALTCAALLIPFITTFYVIFIIILIMLLVSFALMMASPKKAALHDFVARTIVIDLATSVIFDNFVEEAEYIAKEDNLPKEVIAGEEPELKYEK